MEYIPTPVFMNGTGTGTGMAHTASKKMATRHVLKAVENVSFAKNCNANAFRHYSKLQTTV